MKTLKFRSHLADMIMRGEKTTTWRLFDDKDIRKGDEIQLMNWDTKQVFRKAVVTEVTEKKLGEVEERDYEGHERFATKEEMLATYRKYYGERTDENSPLKIIRFELI